MWVSLLGSLQVRVDGAAVPVPAARQRALLAALAVRAGETVSVDELAEILWDGAPPATAAVTIRNYVKRLRLRLGTARRQVVTCWPGYRLEVAEDELDLLAFGRLCRDGGGAVRAGDLSVAWDSLGQALELWHGTPFADTGCEYLQREHVPQLSKQRSQAALWRAEAGLALGRHAELAGELAAWCAAEPLHERFAALRMLALYSSGQHAEALAAYQETRRVLADELGVEPGAELAALHRRVLARDPAPALLADLIGPAAPAPPAAGVMPRQLPAGMAGFVGRSGELDALAVLTDAAAGAASPAVAVVQGPAGVGKTTLAVHFAHLVAGLFPDGQLYADLRGFSQGGGPLPAGQALRGFLDALRVPPQAIPADAEAQARLYRSLLAGKRMLVVLDNARDPAQVRPLLPGAAGCLVLVTSRSQLTGLATTHGARLLPLGLPTEQEARDLLAARLGRARVEAAAAAVTELIELCARLPLALAITAARAEASPGHPLSALAAGLRAADGRLDALDAGDPAGSVRAVFSWSYEQLSVAAARLFRLLAVHPGPDISAPAAASLAGVPLMQARRLLMELTRAHLVAEHVPGRYACHDLLREYAAEQARAVDDEPARQAAASRMLGHYLSTAYAAAVLVNPARTALGVPAGPGDPGEQLGNHQQAREWYVAEHDVLRAVIDQADRAGDDLRAWQLAWVIGDCLDSRGRWQELADLQRRALEAATRLGDAACQAASHLALAGACVQLGRYDLAQAHLADSLAGYRRLGHLAGQARVHLTRGWMADMQERYADALVHSQHGLRLLRVIGDRPGEARALGSIGWCHAHLGRHHQARVACQQALDLLGDSGHRYYQAEIWDALGYIEHQSASYHAAADCYQRALRLFREFGDRYCQATVLVHLGDARHAAGQPHEAREAWLEAEAILVALRHQYADAVRGRLATPDAVIQSA